MLNRNDTWPMVCRRMCCSNRRSACVDRYVCNYKDEHANPTLNLNSERFSRTNMRFFFDTWGWNEICCLKTLGICFQNTKRLRPSKISRQIKISMSCLVFTLFWSLQFLSDYASGYTDTLNPPPISQFLDFRRVDLENFWKFV